MVGLKKSRIRELEAAGEFPGGGFGARSVRWLQSEILEYIQSRPAA
ncbi:MAG: AlpA family phage regulatory protein [Candidatus Thiothrix singaporensis]|uniref:AlpA family phage regulatory protein n=1 Tax=Candidatus Thiothrix singaporensis TaxID=2799669 RepID=A0A7L6AYQ1_9GAMM|nr:MAG: AlpA family phage regulatory protein [Candidatus Thiothrix singaporensis]